MNNVRLLKMKCVQFCAERRCNVVVAGLPIYIHRTSQCDAAGLVRGAGMEAGNVVVVALVLIHQWI